MYSMSVDLLSVDLIEAFGEPEAMDVPLTTLSDVRMLQHFHAVTSLTIGGPVHKNVMHSFAVRKAWDHPHLMHMVLAASAAHLKRLHIHAEDRQQYAVFEAKHWAAGLSLYRRELAQGKQDFDISIATTILTIALTYALDDDLPEDAFCDDNEAFHHAIDPLATNGGFRAVLPMRGDVLLKSAWGTLFLAADDQWCTYSSVTSGIDGLPPAFVELCDLNETSNPENNEYHKIVCLLTPLLLLQDDMDSFGKLFAFPGRTWQEFKPLIWKKDPTALLLLSYWFALLRHVHQWWLTTRARTACRAIVAYLVELDDPRILALLEFPASFGLADLSGIWRGEAASSTDMIPF